MSTTTNLWQNLPSLAEIVDRQPLTVDPDVLVSDAIAMMSRLRGQNCLLGAVNSPELALTTPYSSSVLVLKMGRLVGIFTERDLVKLSASEHNLHGLTIGEVMSTDPQTLVLSERHTVMSALSIFQEQRIRHLPIVDRSGELIGIVTPDRIRQILQPVNLLKFRAVAESMTADVIHVAPTTSLLEIAQMMAERNVSSIVITDQRQPPARPLGIITERDILQAQVMEFDLSLVTAEVVMSAPLFCLQPSDSLWAAQQIMQSKQIRRLVITNERGELAGILTQSDLLKLLDPAEMLYLLERLQQQTLEHSARLEQSNRELRLEVIKRQQIEAELEERVKARTIELDIRTQQLQDEIANHEFQKYALDRAAIVAVTDRHGIITEANDLFCQISQYSRDELIGNTHRIINSGYHPPEFFQNLWATITQGKIWRGEIKNRAKDGSYYWVATTIIPFLDAGGRPFKYLSIRFDITEQQAALRERKQFEESLRESERRFRAIFDNTFQFIGLLDTAGILLEANRTALEAIGAQPSDVVGQPFWQTPWWTHSPDLQIQLQQAIERGATGELVRFEAKHFLADGSFVIVDFSLSPIFDEAGKVVMLIPEGRDITERKAIEHQSEERAALLDIATDAILVRDLDCRIQFWNGGAEAVYGWTAAEAIGRTTMELFYPDPALRGEVERAFDTVLECGAWCGELAKLSKTGKKVIVESRWTLVRDDAGQPRSILSVDTDITEKKSLEQQFLRAQRLESLGSLSSGIAHDLNNILTPIVGAAQLLPTTLPNLDDRNRRLLTMLVDSAKRGSALVKQILSFARGMDGQHATIQVRHILAEVMSIARQTFPRSIEVRSEFGREDLWLVSVDATQIHQVFMNLFVNARDAMPDGGTLTVAAENIILDAAAKQRIDLPPGAYLKIAIADTGKGMSDKILDRIFDPFFTTKAAGTGLGLSTVLGIIKAHGGAIDVQSEVGQGTKFEIYLPAIDSHETEAPAVDQTRHDGKGQLVLVVDDELAVREITQTSLEAYNYRVLLASDGIEAIALYAQNHHSIGIVLVDLMMPNLDTRSVIQTLLKIDPQVKIALMSGLDPTSRVQTPEGVKTFLTKPFTTIELLQTLANLD